MKARGKVGNVAVHLNFAACTVFPIWRRLFSPGWTWSWLSLGLNTGSKIEEREGARRREERNKFNLRFCKLGWAWGKSRGKDDAQFTTLTWTFKVQVPIRLGIFLMSEASHKNFDIERKFIFLTFFQHNNLQNYMVIAKIGEIYYFFRSWY